jgi:hypothetical protein
MKGRREGRKEGRSEGGKEGRREEKESMGSHTKNKPFTKAQESSKFILTGGVLFFFSTSSVVQSRSWTDMRPLRSTTSW